MELIIINRIKELREDNDLYQIDIANMLNVKQSTISDYENDVLDISTDNLVKLADFYKTSVDYILCLTDEEKPHNIIVRVNKNRLKDLRLSKKLSQLKVANYLYITQSNYAKYERNFYDMSINTLIKLSNFYSVSVDYLLYRTDIKNKYSKSKRKK